MTARTDDSQDILFGFSGDDTLKGGGGKDYLYGGEGKDKVWGSDGKDLLVGEDGDDEFRGEKGDDTIWGGAKDQQTGRADGADKVVYDTAAAAITVTLGGSAVPTLSVGDGDGGTDTLHSIEIVEGSNHADTLTLQALTSQVAAAFDHIDLGAGSDKIDISGLAGNVTVDLRDPQNQTLTFGGAVLKLKNGENVVGADAGDTVYLPPAGAPSTIAAGAGDDIIHLAGSGHSITGGGGHDVLDLSTVVAGSRIQIASGTALIRGSGTSSFDEFEEVVGSEGGAMIYGDGRGTRLVGGGGVNYLEGWGTDILEGGSGDTYFSLTGGGTVISGAGNDYIEVSGSAPVTIRFGVGSGHDMLASHFETGDGWIASRQNDTIWLEGLTKDDIELVWDYGEVGYGEIEPGNFDDWYREGEAAIRIKSTGETLYIGELSYRVSHYLPDYEIYFHHLYSHDYDRMHARFEFNRATGYEEGGNPWWLPYANNDEDNNEQTVELAIFSFDGVTKLNIFDLFDLSTISSQSLPPEVKAAAGILGRLGQSGDPGLATGTPGPDELAGSPGDDDLFGGDGNDVISGGGGHDTVRAGAGNDLIIGGSGNGNYNGGAGSDTIDFGWSTAGVVVDLPSGDATGPEIGSHEVADIENVIGGAGDDGLTGDAAENMLEGRAGSDQLYGGDGNDTLVGGADQDLLVGGSGDDVYRFARGDGDDVVRDHVDAVSGGGGTDAIEFAAGIAPSDVSVTQTDDGRDGVHSVLKVISTGHTITFDEQFYSWQHWGVDRIVFANGEAWDRGRIQSESWIVGTDGDDMLYGGSGNDSFRGGLGNDTIRAGAGSDTYAYASGDGSDYIDDESGSTTDVDTLRLTDLNPADVTFSRSGSHAFVKINATGHVITLDEQFYNGDNWGIDRVVFASGEVWDRSRIHSESWIRASSGDDTLWGTNWNDTFHGGLGDDLFRSGGGSDTYIYAAGDGNDYIDDESGSTSEIDTLRFTNLNSADVTLTRSGVHSSLTVNATGHVITFDEQFYSWQHWGIDRIVFADGETWDRGRIQFESWIRGSGGGDTMSGSGGPESLDGGAGGDTMYAGDHNDRLAGGEGMDTLRGDGGDDRLDGGIGTDLLSGGGGADIFRFGDGETGTGNQADRITDFASGLDKIDLAAIDADPESSADQPFTFIGSSAFTGVRGQLRFAVSGPDTVVEGDFTGDGIADFQIYLTGSPALVSGDFIL